MSSIDKINTVAGLGADSSVLTLARAQDGGYYIGGYFRNVAGVSRNGLARLSANGRLDTNFVPQLPISSGFSGYVFSLAVQADGKILVGSNEGLWGSYTNACSRLNLNGSRDTTFTNSISGLYGGAVITTIVPQPDGKILVGGRFDRGGIARLNSNGTLDSSFISGSAVGYVSVSRLLLLPNNQIMVAGSFLSYAGIPRSGLARLNSNGSLDLTFDPQLGIPGVYDIAPLPGDRWAICGSFYSLAGLPRYRFAIIDSNGNVVSNIQIREFAVSSGIQLGVLVEPELTFQILSSSNLLDWQPLYSRRLHQTFTNILLPRPSLDRQFFRIVQPH